MDNKDINNIEVTFDVISAKKEIYDKLPKDDLSKFIIRNIEKNTGVSCIDFYTTSRKRVFVFPRQLCMFFLSKYTAYTTTEIASFFKSEEVFNRNGKAHATIVHAKKVVYDLIETNKEVAKLCNAINDDIILFITPKLQTIKSNKIGLFNEIVEKYISDPEERRELMSKFINLK